MDTAIRAIGEPRRREILRLIWDCERTAGDIAAQFDVSRPAISQHLRVLKDAGFIEERRDGTRRWYRALPSNLGELRPFIEGIWEEQALEVAPAT